MFPSRTLLPILPVLLILSYTSLGLTDSWNGLVIAPEKRCSPYHREDFPRPRGRIEAQIAERQGLVSLYTGRTFDNLRSVRH